MATRTSSRRAAGDNDGPKLTRRRLAAVVAQLGGYVTTLLFFQAIGVPGWWAWIVAAVAEWLLFEFKRGLLTGKDRVDPLGIAALIGDTVLNAGGMWAYVLQLDGTESYKMLSEALKLENDVRLIPALIIALALGLALAIAPQRLWREPDGDK